MHRSAREYVDRASWYWCWENAVEASTRSVSGVSTSAQQPCSGGEFTMRGWTLLTDLYIACCELLQGRCNISRAVGCQQSVEHGGGKRLCLIRQLPWIACLLMRVGVQRFFCAVDASCVRIDMLHDGLHHRTQVASFLTSMCKTSPPWHTIAACYRATNICALLKL